MVNLTAPLNPRQFDVLRWIADGCPSGVMADHTYKTTAVALQNRRLIKISKKGGRWRAEITSAGQRYLSDGSTPVLASADRGDAPQARATRGIQGRTGTSPEKDP
jgi:hypothetical protein